MFTRGMAFERSFEQSIRQPRSRHKQPYSLRLRKQWGGITPSGLT